MESYAKSPMGNMHALDYTSCGVHDSSSELSDSILDLSCKKQTASMSSISNSIDSRPNSPANSLKEHTGDYSDSERKSPFEGRTFMVTPPSESDSPRKIKYEPIYNYSEVSINNGAGHHPGFSVLPMPMPISVVPTVMPSMPSMPTQNGGPVQPAQIVDTSTAATNTTYCKDSAVSPDAAKKAPRPFKAYPKDPLSLTMGPAELMYDQNANDAYSEFRKRMLDSVRRSNEGTNIKMRRVTKSPGLPTSTMDEKDAAYWERRRKNNEAAKRSRDARRAKEDEIAIRAAFLEQENIKLKYELVALRNETAKLRCMIYST